MFYNIITEAKHISGGNDMTVHYYGINNCTLLYYCGYPVLLAPNGTDEALLTIRGFVRQDDGNWIRYVDQFEYGYIMQFTDKNEVVVNEETARSIMYPPNQYINRSCYGAPPPSSENTATMLCIISLCLMLLSLPVSIVGTVLPGGLCYITALVLMIIARVNHPESKFAKVLCIVYVIMTVILVIFTVTAIILLMKACNDCMNSLRSCS